ncbi:MAG: hypothetical protein JSW11_13675 [Candidatus Heimdallarchaeota archaeon]|nr:MAG: hypothetical protein JSW11_13675 [Candidatus Heimdallarchaeota archaeon]
MAVSNINLQRVSSLEGTCNRFNFPENKQKAYRHQITARVIEVPDSECPEITGSTYRLAVPFRITRRLEALTPRFSHRSNTKRRLIKKISTI